MSTTRRVALITGANKGIGFAIAKQLGHKFDGDVLLTARDEHRGLEAVRRLNKDFNLDIKYHQLDIDSDDSIQQIKTFITSKYHGLDVLVNNAAIAPGYITKSDRSTIDDAHRTIETNYRRTSRFCDLILPLLRPHGRVVNLASSAGMLIRVPDHQIRMRIYQAKSRSELDKVADEYLSDLSRGINADKWPKTAYSMSKILLASLTRIQQREFDADTSRPDLAVNCCHPGYVDTDMTDHKGPLSIDEGAIVPVYLALLPPSSQDIPRGQFIWKDKRVADWLNDSLPT